MHFKATGSNFSFVLLGLIVSYGLLIGFDLNPWKHIIRISFVIMMKEIGYISSFNHATRHLIEDITQ